MEQAADQHVPRDPVQPTPSPRESLRLALRELKWMQIEHEHQAESLQRVRRQRARLREQLDLASEALAAVLSEQYWTQARTPKTLGRLARRGGAASGTTEAALVAEVEASRLFDGAWYLRRYPNAVRERIAPALHLVRFGNEMGLDPSEGFSTSRYLTEHPDTGGLPALVHHLRSGADR